MRTPIPGAPRAVLHLARRGARCEPRPARDAGPPAAGVPNRHGGAVLAAALGVALVVLTACTAPRDPDGPIGRGTATGTLVTGPSTATNTTALIPPDPDKTGTTAATGDGDSVPTAPTGPPAAAALRWLDGAQTKPGIVTDDGKSQRWFGRRAGEQAMLGDGWYRYFGADGSLVGCTSSGACVGVAPDNTVAIVAKPTDPREVYASDGTYLGRYAADGDKLAPASDPEPFVVALAHSGVDLAGLVDAATRTAPFAGAVMGDPHLVTRGGQRYTTQLMGQFDARTGGNGVSIELRFSPMAHRPGVSLVAAVAIDDGSSTVVYDMQDALTVNGEMQVRGTDFVQTPLSGGGVLGHWPSAADGVPGIAVVWPDGGSVVATADRALGMTLIAHLNPADGAAGLFGTGNVADGPDFRTRGGRLVSVSDGTASAVESWRSAGGSNLLAPDPDSTEAAPAVPDVDPGALKTAQRLCSDFGIRGVQDLDACAFDVGLTGDTAYLPQHLAVATALQAPDVPSGFARRWPALQITGLASGSDLPASGALDVDLTPGGTQLYRLTLDRAGTVALRSESACNPASAPTSPGGSASATAPTGMDQPSWRLFDNAGRPVSQRLPLCGSHQVDGLPAGDYRLALGNAVSSAGEGSELLAVRATVRTF